MPFIAKSAAPLPSVPVVRSASVDEAAAGGTTVFTASPEWLLTETLVDALQRYRRSVVWVRLGPEDRDPGMLLASVIAGVQRNEPTFGRATLELMASRPGPVGGWRPLYEHLAGELVEALGARGAFVVEHAHYLSGAPLALRLLGTCVLPALPDEVACPLITDRPLPREMLPDGAIHRGPRDLHVDDRTAADLISRCISELDGRRVQRAVALCRGQAGMIAALCAADSPLGEQVVQQADGAAGLVTDLPDLLARAWLDVAGVDAKRTLALALRLGYSHPHLAAAALDGVTPKLGGLMPAPGIWLQALADGWSSVRSIWTVAPPWWALPDYLLPSRMVLGRAADYLLHQGADEQAVKLYLEVGDAASATKAVARVARRLIALGQWETLDDWLGQLDEPRLNGQPWPLRKGAESVAVRERVTQALRRRWVAGRGFDGQGESDGSGRSMLGERASGLHLANAGDVPQGHVPSATLVLAEPRHRPYLAVHLLGPLRVTLNDVLIEHWPSGRGRALLKYLVTHRDPYPPRDVLMNVFWPDARPKAARNNLNVAVHGLRRALQSASDAPAIVFQRDTYRLHPELTLWLDVDEFEKRVTAGHQLEAVGELEAAMNEYEVAVGLYQGDFLADDPYEEWPVLTRERLRVTNLDTMDRLSRLYFSQGLYASCATLCQRIIDADACREDTHQRLMRCYSRQGQLHLALRQYQACVEALRDELDIEPGLATIELAARIRRREPA
jgi:DNA-binding SARP family transcriptional activator